MIPLILLAAIGAGGCLVVPGEYVTIGDLADANPALRELDPAERVFPSPRVGSIRRLGPLEWKQVPALRKYRMPDLCIRRADRELTRLEIEHAIAPHLPDDADWELLDFSRFRVPEGTIEFRREELPRSASVVTVGGAIWRGRVVSEGGEKAPIWARVRIRVRRTVLVAARELSPGVRLVADDVVEEVRESLPFGNTELQGDSLKSPLEVRRPVGKGTVLSGAMVRPYVATVRAGQTIRIVIANREVRLEMAGTVEMTAREGAHTWVRVTATGRKLRGIVEAEQTVLVDVSAERASNAIGMADSRNDGCGYGECGSAVEAQARSAGVGN